MTGKTVTRADLAEAICREVGLSRVEAASLVEMILEEICAAIIKGETVKLSSFATFQIRNKTERIGRNPKTGKEVPITSRRVMTFRASNILKQHVYDGHIGRKKR